mgnify:CR=1 FL=1
MAISGEPLGPGVGDVGVLEHQAGILHVEDCVRAYIDQAGKRGAEIHDEEPVLSWTANSRGVSVTGDCSWRSGTFGC